MAWLPLFSVPAILSWGGVPIFRLLGSTLSLPDAAVAAAKFEAALGHSSRSPPSAGSVARAEGRGARLRVAVKATKLLLTAAGGGVLNLGSAAAIFTALSPSSPSPTSSAALPATAVAASSLPLKTPTADTSTVGFFSPGLVRRLRTGMVASGALITVPLAVLEHPQLIPPFLRPVFEVLLGYPMSFIFYTFTLRMDMFLFMLLIMTGSVIIPIVATGLAALFGFAAGRLIVSPGGLLARSHPPMAVLLPLATSVAAPIAGGYAVSLGVGGALNLRHIPHAM